MGFSKPNMSRLLHSRKKFFDGDSLCFLMCSAAMNIIKGTTRKRSTLRVNHFTINVIATIGTKAANGPSQSLPVSTFFLKHFMYLSFEEFMMQRAAKSITSNGDLNP